MPTAAVWGKAVARLSGAWRSAAGDDDEDEDGLGVGTDGVSVSAVLDSMGGSGCCGEVVVL
jgi:hypothetical protein